MRRVQNRNVVVEYLFTLFISVIPGMVQSIEASLRRPGLKKRPLMVLTATGPVKASWGKYFSNVPLLSKTIFLVGIILPMYLCGL